MKDGSTIAVLERRFRPYFYALPSREVRMEHYDLIKRKILALSTLKSPIIGVEVIKRKYFGMPVHVFKITTVIPEAVREYRDRIKEIPEIEDVLEADIRFTLRYMIDKNIKPFRWYIGEVEEIARPDLRVKRAFALKSDPIEDESEKMPASLSVLAFDIEVYNPAGSPRPTKDPIIIIGAAFNGERYQFLMEGSTDKDALSNFVRKVLELDPDVIVGYNSNRFDWPYIMERAKINGIKLDLGRKAGTEPSPSVHGHISIPGRLNVDLYDFAEEIPELKMKTLEEVCDHFGIVKYEEREHVAWYEIPSLWDSGSEGRKRLLKYNMDDAIATRMLADKFLPFGIQLSSLSGIPLDQVMSASVGFRLEFYLMRQAHKHGELVPNRVEKKPETYRGAVVLKPRPGIHENVVVLDFTSMYPNIMIKYNVGPDTLVRDPNYKGEVYEAPDIGHKFRKNPPGLFKSILEPLLEARRRIVEELKKMPKGTPEYEILNERQKAMKILANAAYGYMGWQVARWYCRECAEAVTAWGRHNILSAIKKAQELGLEVIYGDTDSLFLKNVPEKIKEFIEWVEKELGFDIKVDKVYKRVFFTEAKKRYVGLTEDGTTDVVGFEAVRGDWAEIAKETQFEVARLVLEEGKTSKAIEYVRELIGKLKERKVPYEKLIIWKALSKRVEEYEVDAPHVKAAKRYIEAGIKVMPGDKVGYVITKGPGKISDKAKPYFQATLEDIDVDYYIEHQVVPAAMRILEYFGVSESALKTVATRGQRTLFDYLAKK
uniref:DNA polymerase n=1 Tax=Fervidicoccus fontis TaxID=683846 RepID=A0A7J3ZLJ0_9CREN